MQISHVSPGSLGDAAGIRPGDRLTEVNGRKVRDFLDLHLWLGEERLDLTLERENVYGDPFHARIERSYGRELGLTFPDPRIRICGNDCPFCFVDQLPEQARKNLHVRDDDYRFSYLFGNFITLTNLKEWEFERIIEQELSPLYVSVHALDPTVREKCLKSPRAGEIRKRIEQLLDGGIDLHTQVVLIPGLNDGPVLEETVYGLADYYPGVRSCAVVPVGLTGHRLGLPDLRTYRPAEAARAVATVRRYGRALRRTLGTRFVFVADEFVVAAGKRIPGADYYEDFSQVENGIGLVRRLYDRFDAACPAPEPLRAQGIRRVVVVTGESFAPLLRPRLDPLRAGLPGVGLELVEAENRFFGRPTTVAGLLTGGDIIAAVRGRVREGDLVLVPDEARNRDGVFLDDRTLEDVAEALGTRVLDRWDALLQDRDDAAVEAFA